MYLKVGDIIRRYQNNNYNNKNDSKNLYFSRFSVFLN